MSSIAPERLHEIRYHVREILDTSASLQALLARLDSSEPERLAQALSELEVEVVEHIGYHVREIKKPLGLVLRQTYEGLEESLG